MVKAILVKLVLKKVMEAISKTPDEEIAANHEARITGLEKKLKKLEKKCSKCTK